jgi:5-methylcytosine-specific restriction endonuclease McrA
MEFAAIGGNTCRKHAVEDVMRRYYRKRNGLKQSLAEKQEFICTWCLKSLPDNLTDFYTHIDHIWPVSLGGPDEEWNLQILHYACNIRKGNKLTTLALEYIT